MSDATEAFNDGHETAKQGDPITENPYDEKSETSQYIAWREGWYYWQEEDS